MKLELLPMSQLLTMKIKGELWIVDNLLVRGGISILVAQPKSGKTTFALQLSKSIARGTKALNEFDVEKGTVIYLALEENLQHFQAKLIESDFKESDNISVQIGSRDRYVADKFRSTMENLKPDFLVIDTFGLFFDIKDLNEYVQVNQVLKDLRSIARDLDIHIMLVHHANKSGEGTKSIMGSNAIRGGVDAAIF